MTRGPIRSMAIGGLAFGVLLVVVGTLFLLINQGVIKLERFDFWTVCFSGLIVLGIVVIVGVLWTRRMMRGGWRRWAEGWDREWNRDEGWQRPPPPQP